MFYKSDLIVMLFWFKVMCKVQKRSFVYYVTYQMKTCRIYFINLQPHPTKNEISSDFKSELFISFIECSTIDFCYDRTISSLVEKISLYV